MSFLLYRMSNFLYRVSILLSSMSNLFTKSPLPLHCNIKTNFSHEKISFQVFNPPKTENQMLGEVSVKLWGQFADRHQAK